MSISTRARIGIMWPLFETFRDRTAADMQEVRGFIEPVVREAMAKRARGVVAGQEDSLLQHLLNVTQGEHAVPSLFVAHCAADMKLIIDETIK